MSRKVRVDELYGKLGVEAELRDMGSLMGASATCSTAQGGRERLGWNTYHS